MKRTYAHGMRIAATVALLAATSTHASAEIVGGMVTGGSSGGVFELLDPAPAEAGPDAFESPNLVAFDEVQDLTLVADLPVGGGRIIPAGSIVSSHYVAFDPAAGATIQGFVDFDRRILGVIGGAPGLDSTSSLFGLPGVTYSVSGAIGPDGMPGNPGADMFRRTQGMPRRLNVMAAAGSPGDNVRVITGIRIPEPAAATAIASGLLLLGAVGGGRGFRGGLSRRT
ncbi:MAG: hypothetical protein AAGJ46_08040 [Planctomycetota bacterium]